MKYWPALAVVVVLLIGLGALAQKPASKPVAKSAAKPAAKSAATGTDVAGIKSSAKTAPKSVRKAPQRLPQRLPRMVEVGAEKCIPCIMMKPVLKELRSRYAGQLQVEFVDIWKNPSAGEALKVKTIPTQIFFDAQGREIYRHTGYYSTGQIVKRFEGLGIRFKT